MNAFKLSLCILTILLLSTLAQAQRIDIPAGFPNAENTGYSGTLTPSGAITVTVDGDIIENLEISGGVRVQANNVTIRNCYITGGLYGIQVESGYTGTLIEDCKIYDGTSKGILGANFTARRCDVSEYSDSMLIGSNVLIEDCYLHDFKYTTGSHNDGVQTTGASNITIRGCTIQAFYQNQTSAIIFQTQYAVVDNILVENNFLSGGSYSVYMRNKDTGYGDPTNVSIIDNVFEYDSYASGPLSTDGSGISYSGNIFHTGVPLSQNPVVDNRPPAAEAGSDQYIEDEDDNGSETVTLDGSASEDLDGNIVSYLWSEDGNPISAASQFTTTLDVGVHAINLTVTDDDGDTNTDTLVVTIGEAVGNLPPLADAGADQTVEDSDGNGSEPVILDGSASTDTDGVIVSYIWSESGQQIATGQQPTVTLDVGVHNITLVVTDNEDAADSSEVTITIDEKGTAASQIAYDNVSSQKINGSNTLSWTHTISGGDNRLLVVGLAAEDGTLTDFEVTSVTFGGIAMTEVEGSVSTAGAGTRTQTQLFYMLEADLPSAGTYTVTVTRAGAISYQSAGAVSLENAAQQAPEAVVANKPPSTASSLSTNITTLTDGAWIVDVIGHGLGGSWTATAADQIERWDINLNSAAHAGSTKAVMTAGTTEMAWSFPSTHLIATSLAAFAPYGEIATDPHPGDTDKDNDVDINDFLILKANYGTDSDATWSMGDFDDDGDVDINDFLILKANYGWTGSD